MRLYSLVSVIAVLVPLTLFVHETWMAHAYVMPKVIATALLAALLNILLVRPFVAPRPAPAPPMPVEPGLEAFGFPAQASRKRGLAA